MIPPNRNSQYDSALRRGNAMSAAPTWSGIRKFAKPRPDRRREEQQHQRAVHREQLVVGLLAHQLAARLGQLGRIDAAIRPATRKNASAVTT